MTHGRRFLGRALTHRHKSINHGAIGSDNGMIRVNTAKRLADSCAAPFGPLWSAQVLLHSPFHHELVLLQTKLLRGLQGDLHRASEVWSRIGSRQLEALSAQQARIILLRARLIVAVALLR